MSDDMWRPGDKNPRRPGPLESEMDAFDDDEFGGPLFGETSEQPVTSLDDRSARSGSGDKLSFGRDDTGSLPHWTEPATGEVPRIDAVVPPEGSNDDLDVWSTFTTESPVWKGTDVPKDPTGEHPVDTTGELTWHDDLPATADDSNATTTHDTVAEPVREPARITIGTDPSGMPRRPDPKRRGGSPQRPPSAGATPPPSGDRNLPVAIISGVVLAAVFIILSMWRPAGAVAFVTILLALAAIEYFGKVTEKGYRPAVAAGVAACVAAPLAAYWVGEDALPLVIVFAFLAGALGFIGANSIEVGPMPNMAITMLGVVWIGVMGSYAALILRWSTFGAGTPWGTDTLILVAIGVVANDVGAYFVGSAFGRTPLREWISPNKSIEGFLGGTICTLVVMLIIGMQDLSDTWSSTTHLLLLAIVISIMAPLGDLTESMFKRNLDVKDFGTIVRGHGGILDRFDGFLFALPAVYYLMLVVEPWAAS